MALYPPNQQYQPKRQGGCLGKFLKWGLIAFAVFVVFGVIVAFLGEPDSSNTATTQPQAQPAQASAENSPPSGAVVQTQQVAPTDTPAPPTPIPAPLPVIGQDVVVGDFRYKVLAAANMGNELKVDNMFIDPKTTSGKFVTVQVEMENLDTDPRSMMSVKVKDAKGREFDTADNYFMYIDDAETCIMETFNPNLPRTCTFIYEVPADASGLQLHATDQTLFGAGEEFISLGF